MNENYVSIWLICNLLKNAQMQTHMVYLEAHPQMYLQVSYYVYVFSKISIG